MGSCPQLTSTGGDVQRGPPDKLPSAASGYDVAPHRYSAFDAAGPAKLLRTPQSRLAQMVPKGSVPGERAESVGDLLLPIRIKKERMPVGDFEERGGSGAGDGCAARHGFDHRQTKAFEQGWEDKADGSAKEMR